MAAIQPVDNVFKAIVDKQKSTWECSACLNRNNESNSKCACCDQSKEVTKGVTANDTVPAKSQFSFGSSVPKSTFSFGSNAANANTNATTSVAPTFSFGNLAQKPNAQSATFTFGNAAKSESDALASSKFETKPTQNPSSSAPLSTILPSSNKTETTNSFKSIVEKQKATTWECTSCMTNNPNDKEKCACCETPKPGTVAKDSVKKDFGFTTNQKFSFGAPATSAFSFGSQPENTNTSSKPTFQFSGSASSSAFSMATNKPAEQQSSVAAPTLAPSVGQTFIFGSALSKDVTDTGPAIPATTNIVNKGITILNNVLVKPAENGPSETTKPFSFGQSAAKSSDDNLATKPKKRANTEQIDSNVSTKLPTTSIAPFVFGQPQQPTNNIFGAIASNQAATTTTKESATIQSPSFSFGSSTSNQSASAFPANPTFSFGTAAATAPKPAPSAFGSAPAVNTPSQPIFGSNAFSSASSPSSSVPTLGGFSAPNPAFGSSAPAFGTPSPSNNEVN